MNDGLVEVFYYPKQASLPKMISMWELVLQGGLNLYDAEPIGMGRGKRIKLTAQGKKGETQQPGKKQAVMADGELLEFEKTLVLECVPGGVEFLFDHEQYFKDFGILKD